MSEKEFWIVERDGTRIAPLPDAQFNHCEWELNGPGSASFSIDPLARNATAIEGVRREIQIWINGVLRWWGVPWGIQGNHQQITINMEGLESLFKKRFIDRTTLLYTSLDQWQIAFNLIDYAQDESVEDYRDLNIGGSAFTTSGITRSREYKREDHKMIYDLLKEFDSRTLKNGFDWEIDISQGGGSRFWTPYYPKKGAIKPNYTVLWTPRGEQRTVSDFNWTEDFLNLATLVYVTGGSVSTGTSSIRKEGKYEDTTASSYWGQMQRIVSDGSELDEDWLEDRAEQEVALGSVPKVVTSIQTATATDISALGQVVVGDWIPVRIDHGRIQVDALHRVDKLKLDDKDVISFGFGEVVEL